MCSHRDHISTSTHQVGRPEPGSLLTFPPRFLKSVLVNAWMVPHTSRTPNKKVLSLALRGSHSVKTSKCSKTNPYAPLPFPQGGAQVSRGPEEAGSIGAGDAAPWWPRQCTQPAAGQHSCIYASV